MAAELPESMSTLIPSAVVQYLDKYIVGQQKAKRAVAVALRNRIRRRRLPADLAREIVPKNILMVGPTGVGKTEIARRLADLVQAPFIKVEATKFTEVGYVGRDVESMIRDLVERAVQMVKKKMLADVQEAALGNAQDRLVDYLLPSRKSDRGDRGDNEENSGRNNLSSLLDYLKSFENDDDEQENSDDGYKADKNTDRDSQREKKEDETNQGVPRAASRERMLTMLIEGKLDERDVEIDVPDKSSPIKTFNGPDVSAVGINISEMIGGMMPGRTKKRRMKVKDALKVLQNVEAEKLIDMEAATREALDKAQQEGIVFIDEIDKITSRGNAGGPDVSREGVQRDLLPIVEGCTVSTKYGPVKTDHIFFIAAGAFHQVKPSDLVPELQGRLPIRVELDALGKEELKRILKEPEHNLIRQSSALIATEGVTLNFSEDSLDEIAALAEKMNLEIENIGARRLHTILEQLLEEISFTAPERSGETIVIDGAFVRQKLENVTGDKDLRRYLL